MIASMPVQTTQHRRASIQAQHGILIAKPKSEPRKGIGERKIEARWLQSEAALQKAFDEIEKSGATLRQVIDAIPTLVWCNLPDGPNEFLNRRWHDYTGLSPEESHGWGWQVAFHPDDLPLLMGKWRELLTSGQPGEIEARLRRFDGVYRWFLICVEPLHDEAGRIVRWFGTSTDIEDRKRAEDAATALSPRERCVLLLICQGLSNKGIARELQIAPETVKSHAKQILLKLSARTRAEAVARAAGFKPA
jgi:PAS domain S-box-containing protein